jgi:predicted RNA-binding protein with PUA-like domain
MNYWLIKSEPDCYSIDDLKRDKTTAWSGIRNYQARNFIQSMQVGDLALFYHSSSDPKGVAGIAKVIKKAYPDKSALDKKDDHYDPKSTKTNPIWFMVDFGFIEKFKNFVTLDSIKFNSKLSGIVVAKQGSRLSVQPVSETHFKIIERQGRGR